MTLDKPQIIKNDYPIHGAMCQFSLIGNHGHIFGFLNWDTNKIELSSWVSVDIRSIITYRYVLNNKGGFIFMI
jgi:hypothetical protein